MDNREIFITNKKIKNLKICLLSDIHYSDNFNLKIFDKILKQINCYNPDYIFLIGDIVDNTEINYTILYEFLIKLEKNSKVFISIGNHDIYRYPNNQKNRKLKDMLTNNWEKSNYNKLKKIIIKLKNTYLLDNKTYIDEDNNITITGIHLSYEYYKYKEPLTIFEQEIKKININPEKKYYNILLIHSPYNVYKKPNLLSAYDLVLSGHMHGGLVPPLLNRIFNKNRGLISPRKEILANYVRGRTKTKYFEGYIYEGITKLALSTKFLHIFDFIYPKEVKYLEIKKIDTK